MIPLIIIFKVHERPTLGATNLVVVTYAPNLTAEKNHLTKKNYGSMTGTAEMTLQLLGESLVINIITVGHGTEKRIVTGGTDMLKMNKKNS